MLADLIKEFCNNNENYEYYQGYSGRGMFCRKCPAIVVKQGSSYMNMIMEFTQFLDSKNFDDSNLECEGIATDDLGLDTIVYFPNAREV